MSSTTLLELQTEFAEWMTGSPCATLTTLIEGAGLTPEDRLGIYRNIVTNNLSEALQSVYPAVRALVGDAFFDLLCERYIRGYPSGRGTLQDYGARFARLVEETPEAADVAYLADVARLEWTRQESALAPLQPCIGADALAGIAACDYGRLRLRLHPSLQLLHTTHPALDIWLYCRSPQDARLNIDVSEQFTAVWRSGEQIAMQAIDAGWYAFARRLGRGERLQDAYDAAHFDPSSPLRWLFAEGLVAAASL